MGQLGPHVNTFIYPNKDINGLCMVTCKDCRTCAHATSVEQAEIDLALLVCVLTCANCNALRDSHSENPAVPIGGDVNLLLHVCPSDGRRWWQGNTHFHLWQQVTSETEWTDLLSRRV